MQYDTPLTLAIPKGRLADEVTAILDRAGIDISSLSGEDRALLRGSGDIRFALLRNEDVPTYVERGAMALGIVGMDVLREKPDRDVIEYADLGIGFCEMVLAFPRGVSYRRGTLLRVATKYPHLARGAMENTGYRCEIITLRGSCEIAPAAGLADAIVDLSATGETLRANNLEKVKLVGRYTSWLILNPGAYRTDPRVRHIAEKITRASQNGCAACR